MLIALAVSIPYMFVFVEAIAHSLFRNRRGPSFRDILIVCCLFVVVNYQKMVLAK